MSWATSRPVRRRPAVREAAPRSPTNAPADLDSLCSPILLAYLRTYAGPGPSGAPPTLHIPLCHLTRGDLALRPEYAEVLRRAAVTPDDVLTLTDLPGPDALAPADTRWLLVDHNCLTGMLRDRYSAQVRGCIDHHKDDHGVPEDGEPRVIATSGSCASLIVEECQASWDVLARDGAEETALVDAQLAHLALGPILVDTSNLKVADKTTDHDTRAVAYLEAKVQAAGKALAEEYQRDALYGLLARLKEDISAQSLRDVLSKDYKEFGNADLGELKMGTSSAPRSIAFLVQKARDAGQDFVDELRKWAEEKQLDQLAVLTCTQDGADKDKRELLLWARNERAVRAARGWEADMTDVLGLRRWQDGELDADGPADWRRCWSQGNTAFSRKKIAPSLREKNRNPEVRAVLP